MESTNYNLRIFPLAQFDMEQIFEYISVKLGNPIDAVKLMNEFEKTFENICLFPESCPYINNEFVKDRSLRKLVINNYIAFYRVQNYELFL